LFFPLPLLKQKLVALLAPGRSGTSTIRETLLAPECGTMQSLQAATELACDV
jgi:hypothetical protein